MISEDKENAELLNSFFSNAVKNLQIPEFGDSNPLAENIPHPIFKAKLKHKNHPSIIANKNARNGSGFYFCGVSVIGFDLIISEPLKKFFRKVFSPVSSVLFLFAVVFIFSVSFDFTLSLDFTLSKFVSSWLSVFFFGRDNYFVMKID